MIRQFLANLRQSKLGWIDEYGRDGWIVMNSKGIWAAGTLISDAIEALPSMDGIIAMNLVPIRQEIRENLRQTTFIQEN